MEREIGSDPVVFGIFEKRAFAVEGSAVDVVENSGPDATAHLWHMATNKEKGVKDVGVDCGMKKGNG